ncbi:MAG: NAD-dependent epimerase/dehydratase family protein [Actinobacteria bacterium]|nr:NAD-dependent epimerase/dehydratase family protein [Actinomycetota bacterium]
MTSVAYKGRAALVAGGLGFIGSNLAIRLVGLGADVTVVDASIPGHGANAFNLDPVRDQVRIVGADLRDGERMDVLVRGQEVVFSLAGQVSHLDSMADPLADLGLNYASQLSLLEACRRSNPHARVIFAGSRQQYGRPQYLPVDESHPLTPIDVNGINKTAAERAFLLYHEVYGMATCALRLTNTYGPRMQMRHPRQGFASWFVRLALEGREIELFGGGVALRDFNYVGDVVDAFLACGADDRALGEVFNLGHARPVSLREFTEILLDLAGGGSSRDVPFPPERASIDVGNVYADFSKIREALGWSPRVDLREGLALTVEYYRAHYKHFW